MDGFKSNTKMSSSMPCYKTGGIVKRAKGGSVKHPDVKEDKKLIKKELSSVKITPKKTGGAVTGDKGASGSTPAKKESTFAKGGDAKKERSMKKSVGDAGKPSGSAPAARVKAKPKKAATPAPDAKPFGMEQPVAGGMGAQGVGAAPPPPPGMAAPAFNNGGGVHYHTHTYHMGGSVGGYDMGGMVAPGGGAPMGAAPPPGGMGGAPGDMGAGAGNPQDPANLMALKRKLAMLASQQAGGGMPPPAGGMPPPAGGTPPPAGGMPPGGMGG